MINPLGFALRRWRLYKRLLIVFAIINSLSVAAALVVGIRYFSYDRSATQQEQTTLAKVLQTNNSPALIELQKSLANRSQLQLELIAIGILTFIFGIVLPLLVMHLISCALQSLRREIQRSIFDFLRSWRQTEHDFAGQDGAFKNPEFWLQIVLLCGQFFGETSSHPAAQMAGEIALTLRNELKKSRTPS